MSNYQLFCSLACKSRFKLIAKGEDEDIRRRHSQASESHFLASMVHYPRDGNIDLVHFFIGRIVILEDRRHIICHINCTCWGSI